MVSVDLTFKHPRPAYQTSAMALASVVYEKAVAWTRTDVGVFGAECNGK